MNDEFVQIAKNRGKDGLKWLEDIPKIITQYEKKWSIKVFSPFKLSYNYVAPAEKLDGTQVVIKIGFPKDREFQTEIDALSVFNGDGIEKILEADKENWVMLIEKVTPGLPLSTLEDDEEATRILAGVMKKLWKPIPRENKFIPISEWMKAIPKLKLKYKGRKYPHISGALVDKAESLFEELIATSETPVLLHGDLHQDNILSSDRAGWLAIDPKGIAAERAYETGAMIRNPYPKMYKHPDLKEIITKRINILSEELEIDSQRIYKWCLAQTVLSAVWSIEDEGGRWEHALSVAEIMNEIKI